MTRRERTVRWTVYWLMYGSLWFAANPLGQLQRLSQTSELLNLVVGTFITSAIAYFFVGRILVWIILKGFVLTDGIATGQRASAEHRAFMKRLHGQWLSHRPQPVERAATATTTPSVKFDEAGQPHLVEPEQRVLN
jgi:hypothetical protein